MPQSRVVANKNLNNLVEKWCKQILLWRSDNSWHHIIAIKFGFAQNLRNQLNFAVRKSLFSYKQTLVNVLSRFFLQGPILRKL